MEQKVKRAFYDFSVAPYSYDFVTFLACARANECTQVVFVPGTRMGIDQHGKSYEYQKCTLDEQQRRLKHLLLPLCNEAIVCNTREAAKELWHEGCFPPDYTVEYPTFSHMLLHLLVQRRLYPLQAKQHFIDEVIADVGPNPIVIPMRECPYRQIRNSNEEAWVKVAEWLGARGENVVFIPDTAVADKVYPVGKTYKKAALSVLHRLALTQIAKLTIGVNSGNMIFAFISRHPMLYFNPIVEGSREASEDFWEGCGIKRGAQLPWFTNLQRIVWGVQDDYEDIIRTLETWYEVRDNKGQWPPAIAPTFPTFGVVSNDERSEHVRVAMQTGYPFLKWDGRFTDEWLSLACYGPSLKRTWQNLKRPIMAVSGAHDFLISNGIVPDYYVACDPREEQAEFLKNPHPDVKYFLATCMHPKVFEQLKGYNVNLWHLHNGPGSDAGIRKHDPHGELIGGGTTVGMRALEIAARLGFKNFDIHGMDCSYDADGRHAGPHPGKSQKRFGIRCGNNPREFFTSPQMKEAAEEMMRFLGPHPVYDKDKIVGYERLNLGIRMNGDGLLQAMWQEYQKQENRSAVMVSG